MSGPEDWEGAAAALLEETCTSAGCNMIDLADACGLVVQYRAKSGAEIDGSVLWVESRGTPERAQALIAHELGHFALKRAGLPDSERGATYVGGCLRMPRREMLRDLRETAWSLAAMMERHPYASAVALAVRITQLRTAALALFDPCGRVRPWRVASERVARDVARAPTTLEHDLAIAAHLEGREVRHGQLVVAIPLRDERTGEERVLVVGHVEDLRACA